MKKVVLFCLLVCVAFMANAQDLPYSKYINYTKQEFKDNRFKYDKYTNTWALHKTSKLNATLNVLSILVDAEEDVRPDVNDYSIVVQLGKDSKVSYVLVEFYNDIRTGVEPSSEYLDKQVAKQAKRDAKGKKKKSVDELM